MGDTGTLVLLRHGESEWNASNQFTGWVDVNLTDKGRGEAVRGGELLTEHNLLPDVLYTSLLRRAITTAHLALDAADRLWIPVHRTWRLNERHYGALQGLDKAEIRDRYGDEQFMTWRRSYDTPPPPIEKGSEYSQDADPRYVDIGGGPLTECLSDVVARFLPYFTDVIIPDLRVGKTVLIAGARQLAARAGEIPRRHVRRRHHRAQHSDRYSAALRPGRPHAPAGGRRQLPRPGCGGRRRGRGGQPRR